MAGFGCRPRIKTFDRSQRGRQSRLADTETPLATDPQLTRQRAQDTRRAWSALQRYSPMFLRWAARPAHARDQKSWDARLGGTKRDGCGTHPVQHAANAYLPTFQADYNRRFGRAPLNRHDAHRVLRDDEDLDLIFTWQAERKLSRNLTFQYKRVIYLVAPGPATLPLAGARCRVHEHDDGRVEVRHAGHSLPCQVFFDKTPRVQQSAVVANKRLGAVLGKIRSDQQERDRQRLANRNVTLRQKDRIRVAIARAAASDPRPDL